MKGKAENPVGHGTILKTPPMAPKRKNVKLKQGWTWRTHTNRSGLQRLMCDESMPSQGRICAFCPQW